jgi:HK97 family phage prohead protease
VTIEYREVRAEPMSAAGDTLYGLVTPFNTETIIGDLKRGGFYEQIAPTAFTKTLQERDVVMINAHDTSMPLCRMSVPEGEGSLTLTPDPDAGLRAVGVPVQTSYGQDVLRLASRGVIKGMSFGFEVLKDSWTDDQGRASNPQTGTHRTIHEVRLHEVTTTAFPAYETTELSARDSIAAARGTKAERQERAAAASYKDLYTCGECGATSQYGSFCGACGEPMSEPSQSGNLFCTVCGGPVDGDGRSGHAHKTTRDSALEDGAGSATPDDDERADLALLGQFYSLREEIV